MDISTRKTYISFLRMYNLFIDPLLYMCYNYGINKKGADIMIYGYARCSTNENKQDVNRQIRELKELGATDKTIYKEYITGTADNKVEFNRLLVALSEGDTIVVTEVSRISRSTKQLCDIIELVQERKLKLVIKDSITIDCTSGTIDPMTKAFLQISGVFAELERNIISQRVKSGMENAKAKGKRIGRPTLDMDTVTGNDKFMNAYKLWKNKSIKKIDIKRLTGMSRVTIDTYIKMLEG